MPYGTDGSTMLMLSGGIDSPVAGYMMARRGVELAVYITIVIHILVKEQRKR